MWSPDGTMLVTGSYDQIVKVWDARTGAVKLSLRGHTEDNEECECFPRHWTKPFPRPECPVRGHCDSVRSVFSPCGAKIVIGGGEDRICSDSGDGDYSIRIWDAKTGTLIGSPLRGHSKDIPECTCLHAEYGYNIYTADPKCPVSGHSDW
jgi:WD40 repeat protein